MTSRTDELRQQHQQTVIARERIDYAAQAEQLEKQRQANERAQLAQQEAQLAEELLFAEFDDALPYNRQLVDENRAAVDQLAQLMVQPSITWDEARSLAKIVDDTFQRQQAHKNSLLVKLQNHFYEQYPMTDKVPELIAQKHAVGTQLGRRGVYTKLTNAWPIWGAILQAFNAAGANDKLFYQAQAIGYALTGMAYTRRPEANHPSIKWDVDQEVTKNLSMPKRNEMGYGV